MHVIEENERYFLNEKILIAKQRSMNMRPYIASE